MVLCLCLCPKISDIWLPGQQLRAPMNKWQQAELTAKSTTEFLTGSVKAWIGFLGQNDETVFTYSLILLWTRAIILVKSHQCLIFKPSLWHWRWVRRRRSRTTRHFGGALTVAALFMGSSTTPMLTSCNCPGPPIWKMMSVLRLRSPQVRKLEHCQDGQIRLPIPSKLPPWPVPLPKGRHNEPYGGLDGGKRGLKHEAPRPIPALTALELRQQTGSLHVGDVGRPQHSGGQLDEQGAEPLSCGSLSSSWPDQSVQRGAGASREGRVSQHSVKIPNMWQHVTIPKKAL